MKKMRGSTKKQKTYKNEILVLKNTITKMKNSIENFKGRLDHAEEKINSLETGHQKLPDRGAKSKKE